MKKHCLSTIANSRKTDKGTTHGLGHGYSLLYDLLLGARRHEPLEICEVGLCVGGPEVVGGAAERSVERMPSVATWLEYFEKARVVGVDISDFSKFNGERFTFVQADCGSDKELERVGALGRKFDLIIDDGSHAAFHQQLTLLKLFPLLNDGGIYVIEDMQWQPDTYATSLPPAVRTDIVLEEYQRTGQFPGFALQGANAWKEIGAQLSGVFLFDEDWLYRGRRQFNRKNGLSPEHNHDDLVPGFQNLLRWSAWRRAMGVLGHCFLGESWVQRRPRIKMAVLHKGSSARG